MTSDRKTVKISEMLEDTERKESGRAHRIARDEPRLIRFILETKLRLEDRARSARDKDEREMIDLRRRLLKDIADMLQLSKGGDWHGYAYKRKPRPAGEPERRVDGRETGLEGERRAVGTG